MPKTVVDLVKHMNTFKDAIIIMGPGSTKGMKPEVTREELEANFTKKVLRREPEKFWKFFKERVYIDPDTTPISRAQQNIAKLCSKGLVSVVINTTTDGLLGYYHPSIDMLNLHGTSLTYRCQNPKCKIEYTHHYVTSSDGIPTCEVCGRELKPNLLLVGDNYDDNEFHAMKLKMVDTHTLILIGFDFTEEPLTEILASFCDIKLLNKSTGKPEDVKMLVTVHEPGTHINEEDIGFFEFWVEDDCGEATGRLLKAFEE